MLHRIVSTPGLDWFVMLALCLVQFVWPPKGWRAWTIAVCTVIVCLVLVFRFVR